MWQLNVDADAYCAVQQQTKAGGLSPLPIRLKPLGVDDPSGRSCESIGSWLFRLQQRNGLVGIGSLLTAARVQGREVDVPRHTRKLVEQLAALSGRTEREVHPMVLSTGQRADGDRSTKAMHEVRGWLLGVPFDAAGRAGMVHVVCPLCLATDETPYWRKSWRLITTTRCEEHGRTMLDRCPSCAAAFVIDRLRETSLDRCARCRVRIQLYMVPRNSLADACDGIAGTIGAHYVNRPGEPFPPGLLAQRMNVIPSFLSSLCRLSGAELRHLLQVALKEPAIEVAGETFRPSFLPFNSQSIATRRSLFRLLDKLNTRNPEALFALLEKEPRPKEWPARCLQVARSMLKESTTKRRRSVRIL